MKAICIVGSPRNNGNTAIIVDKVIEGMEEAGIEVCKVCLGDMNLNFCTGCKSCYSNGQCVQSDDMNIIMGKIVESDIVLVASPSYWGDITGHLKVFFDRNTPYCDTNENRTIIPTGKKGVSIALRAGSTQRENIHIIESIEHYYGHLGIEPIEKFMVESVDTIDDLMRKDNVLNEAYELGLRVSR